MIQIEVGVPHFRAVLKQHRSNNYTLEKILNEFIDNIVKKSTRIDIQTIIHKEKLYEMKISDNYENGFENILENGSKNPFNMGHERIGHNDDSETSEFGVGMKAGAMSACDKFIVYTRTGDCYYRVVLDFVKMQLEEDFIQSYQADIQEIMESEYRKNHPMSYGSTLILSQIRKEIFTTTGVEQIDLVLSENIGKTYSYFMKNGLVNIYINHNRIPSSYSFFEDERCMPFMITKKIYYLQKDDEYKILVLDMKTNRYKVYPEGKEVDFTKYNGYNIIGSISKTEKASILIDSTFTLFSNQFDKIEGSDEGETINSDIIPRNRVEVFKDNRLYGFENIDNHGHVHGSNNYTIHRIQFFSKEIGRELGITYNKSISFVNNDLTKCVISIVTENRIPFTASRNTDKFRKLYKTIWDVGFHDIPEHKQPIEKVKNPETSTVVSVEVVSESANIVIEEPNPLDFKDPIEEKVIEEPMVEKVIEEPIVEKVIEEPIVEKVIEEPIVEKVIEEPMVEKVIEEPIVEKVIEEPNIQKVIVVVESIDSIFKKPEEVLTPKKSVEIQIEKKEEIISLPEKNIYQEEEVQKEIEYICIMQRESEIKTDLYKIQRMSLNQMLNLKGNRILSMIYFEDAENIESLFKDQLKQKMKSLNGFGGEYYEGNFLDIHGILLSIGY